MHAPWTFITYSDGLRVNSVPPIEKPTTGFESRSWHIASMLISFMITSIYLVGPTNIDVPVSRIAAHFPLGNWAQRFVSVPFNVIASNSKYHQSSLDVGNQVISPSNASGFQSPISISPSSPDSFPRRNATRYLSISPLS